jgi:hypothetical protein
MANGKPQTFDGNYTHPPDNSGPQPDSTTVPPVVPGDPSSVPHGGIQVSTSSLTYFADAVDQLNTAVTAAYDKLNGIRPVAPGAFKDAYDIRSKVNGSGDDAAGLKGGYLKVLNDLNNGLLELRDGMKGLASKYQSVEDVNGITADKFTEAVQNADGQFAQANTDGMVT